MNSSKEINEIQSLHSSFKISKVFDKCRNVFTNLDSWLKFLLWDVKANYILLPLLFILEYVLGLLIIHYVPYTEIDYLAYMQQVQQINAGQKDYMKITGNTGPLVYPAGHVAVYRIMERFTNGIEKLKTGQEIFMGLYLVTLVVHFTCYQILELPPWCIVLACCSKRLHSIYILRLFNDTWATLFASVAVLLLLLSCKYRSVGAIILAALSYGIATSIKMSTLLYFPGIILSAYLLSGGVLAVVLATIAIVIVWNFYIGYEFLSIYPYEYLTRSFDFSRTFMYKWSINWQHIEEEVFLNHLFHITLLVSHIIVLLLFIFTRYGPLAAPNWFSSVKKSLRNPFSKIYGPVTTPHHIAYILLTSNFIGIFFSRSLHYQFLTWYHWTLPALLHWTNLPAILAILWYFLHDYCWRNYPPNATSSLLLYLLNAILLIMVYIHNPKRLTFVLSSPKKHQ